PYPRVSASSSNTCRLLARDHAAPEPTLALSKAIQPCCGPVRTLAWCSRPRNSAASLDEAMAAEDLYREVILDHYKNPRGHGVLEDADAQAEGVNPLCGDEITIFVQFGEDGETIVDVKFSGRGCAISQASTSMLMEMVKGRKAHEIAELPKEELLEEVGIPLTPIRLKCALLGLGVLKVALHRAKGTP